MQPSGNEVPLSPNLLLIALFAAVIGTFNARKHGSRIHLLTGAAFAAVAGVISRLAHLGVIKGKGAAQVVPEREYSVAEVVLLSLPAALGWFLIALAMAWGVDALARSMFGPGPAGTPSECRGPF